MSSDLAAYPISQPGTGIDSRFTIGLALDVADVLAQHGYPPITTGTDLLRVQQALFTLIYQENR
ncbi:hypothetical protein [Phytohabitans rumicis]|uniref:Uncharacterized protein n=1 Tax=Phytohabitans rumicis TaxID=1076125 RepID=A0A6V8LE99_9ACTN|nr:hypothetical protein [Phytohabitans rumicis]GFJ93288.1 hypothetical protein Prum_069300 [Phytohabitans rumicis]